MCMIDITIQQLKTNIIQSYTFKGERKLNFSNSLSLGFGSDYNYNKGDFKVHGNWGLLQKVMQII